MINLNLLLILAHRRTNGVVSGVNSLPIPRRRTHSLINVDEEIILISSIQSTRHDVGTCVYLLHEKRRQAAHSSEWANHFCESGFLNQCTVCVYPTKTLFVKNRMELCSARARACVCVSSVRVSYENLYFHQANRSGV